MPASPQPQRMPASPKPKRRRASPRPQRRRSPDYHFVPLALARQFEALAAQRGVSKVARGEQPSTQTEGGFFQAAKRAGGDWRSLAREPVRRGAQQTWWQRRADFCARHRAQQRAFGEASLERQGRYRGTPTRRELGLLMWMCSSLRPARLRQLLPRVQQLSSDEKRQK